MKKSRSKLVVLFYLVMFCMITAGGLLLLVSVRSSLPYLKQSLGGEVVFDPSHHAVIFSVIMVLWIVEFILGLTALWYLFFKIIRPFRRAEEFVDKLLSGENPPPLSSAELTSSQLRNLFSALNILRDRLRGLNARLEHGLSHEAELRRELEKYGRMQITLMARLLPETRRSIGVIKGLLLGGEASSEDRGELYSRALHRTAALSREIERLVDFSRLALARWNRPDSELFEVPVFMRELVNRSTMHLRARNISFESGFSGRPPGRIQLDRELLYQLISIMIRAVGRRCVSGNLIKLTCRGDGKVAEFEVSCSACDWLEGDFMTILAEAVDSGFSSENLPVEVMALGVVQDMANRLGCKLSVRQIDGRACLIMELPPEACRFDSNKLEYSSFDERAVVDQKAVVGVLRSDRIRKVLMWTEDGDEALAVKAVLSQSGIEVGCFATLEEVEEELPKFRYSGVIISQGAFGINPEEVVFRLRRLVGRPNLTIALLTPQMSDEVFSRLADLDRVNVFIMPVNYEMLAAAFV